MNADDKDGISLREVYSMLYYGLMHRSLQAAPTLLPVDLPVGLTVINLLTGHTWVRVWPQ